MRTLPFSLLAFLVSVSFAHAAPQPDYKKLCEPVWPQQVESAKADLIAGLRATVLEELLSLYQEARHPIEESWVSFKPQIEINAEAKMPIFTYGPIVVVGGGREDFFTLSSTDFAFGDQQELIDPITLSHEIIYDPIGEVIGVDCWISRFGNVRTRNYRITNAHTNQTIAEPSFTLKLPLRTRVPVQN